MTTRLIGESALYLVVNASMKESDFAYIGERLSGRAQIAPAPERALLALQGPAAAQVLERHAPGIAGLTFMRAVRAMVSGAPAIISRTGYTGEDGFEISLEGRDAERVARALLGEPEVLPIGLGARDSLRLEAGLCLYGHDMDESTDPVEANLVWSIGKRRKLEGGFAGADLVQARLHDGASRKRVGIRPEGRAPAREGTQIAVNGMPVGIVTSGGFGPSLNGPCAMGYVQSEFSKNGAKLELLVRGKTLPAEVAPMPFVPHRYLRPSTGSG
jgi:aminomethyltransferase